MKHIGRGKDRNKLTRYGGLIILVMLLSGCGHDNSTDTTEPTTTNVSQEEANTTETATNDIAENDTSNEENSDKLLEEIMSYSRKLEDAQLADYSFTNVSVHDPSVIKEGDTYYVFGSHLAAAKSNDLMHWTQISDNVRNNPMFPDVETTLAETLQWAEARTLWAPDVTKLADGNFYFYYNACRGDSPLSAMGVAKASQIEGPYEDLGIILKSGMWDQVSPDGAIYDATVHPNVVDPQTFFDKNGKYWMVYGSYSGGIFIMEMNETTGLPLEGQGYGKKLLGANHARIEGPYILYSEETDYYYLFLSFGGLDANGGYNIRVARSKNPDGPYIDSEGQDMINAQGDSDQLFYDPPYEPYGHKLMGNSFFKKLAEENGTSASGYVSPGHNSAYYDEDTDKYFIFFHTRFYSKGEMHQVRVHQFFMNADGWPVIAPYRYTGETIETVTEDQVTGTYKLIDHGHEISADIHFSSMIALKEDGTVIGEKVSGTWELTGDYQVSMTLDGQTYTGVFLKQYDEYNKLMTMTFTLGGNNGVSLWGSQTWLSE